MKKRLENIDGILDQVAEEVADEIVDNLFGKKGGGRMADQTKNTPDRVGSRVEELSTERMVQISKRLYRILQEEGCTVAEAGKVLNFTHEAVLAVTRVRCDFPLDA